MRLLLIILFGAITFCHEANQQIKAGVRVDDVILKITPSKTKITQAEKILSLTFEATNVSKRKVHMLTRKDFATHSYREYQLFIYINGKKKRIVEDFGFVKKSVPYKSEYKKLRPGESYSFVYDLDMTTLMDSAMVRNKKNQDFGIYTISARFKDIYRKKRRSVRALESLPIEVEYTP